MKKSINAIQADIIFKALYYAARNEGVKIPEYLTEIYEVLAEQNPQETYIEHTVEVMESLAGFIVNSSEYEDYFEEDQD
jgi:transcriptional regulator